MRTALNEMTESEFLSFVQKIYNADYPSEEEQNNAVLAFEEISEHPAGSDLLYYPEDGKSGPVAVVKEVQEWRTANGLPGFKIN